MDGMSLFVDDRRPLTVFTKAIDPPEFWMEVQNCGKNAFGCTLPGPLKPPGVSAANTTLKDDRFIREDIAYLDNAICSRRFLKGRT